MSRFCVWILRVRLLNSGHHCRVREKLGKMIQTAGAEGHSSVEDASATLDLVRWFILNKQKSAIHADVGS